MLSYAGDYGMTLRSVAIAILASLLFSFAGAQPCRCETPQQDEHAEFRRLLEKLATYPPTPYSSVGEEEGYADTASRLFNEASGIVAQELNASPSGPGLPSERATETLKKLEQISAEVNAAWPDVNRFHFEVVAIPPALVIIYSVRTHSVFSVLGVPTVFIQAWRNVSDDFESFDELKKSYSSQIAVVPLHRGPSGIARFLVMLHSSGAGGPTGIAYEVLEWNPNKSNTEQVIKILDGADPLEDVPGFSPIGKFQAEGTLITLPYCQFSPIDTWDNPSLCAVDTYDLSGDRVGLRSRIYNRPELAAVAQAFEYAQKRDYPAVLGYCASSSVARKMVRDITADFNIDTVVQVTRTGAGKKHVVLGDEPAYHFDVEKRNGRWVVAAFSIK